MRALMLYVVGNFACLAAAQQETVTCDFEDGHLCGWDLQEDDAALNHWTWADGPVGLGPYVIPGAAAEQGFVYVSSNALPSLPYAAEMGTHYQPATDSPFEFYFRAWGLHGTLDLFLDVQDGARYSLWHAVHYGNEWERVQLNVCSSQRFKVCSVPIYHILNSQNKFQVNINTVDCPIF